MTILDHDEGRSGGTAAPAAERRPLANLPEHAELVSLVRRARSGDLAAQSELVRRYRPRLAGLLRPMIRQSETVEDLVQTVSIKMLGRLGGLREPARFETWLFTLARNVALDHLRRIRCRPVTTVDDVAWRSFADPAAEERSHELMEALEVALRGSPKRDRRLLDQVIAGASYRAIASREGLSIGALKVRLHRLRVYLRVSVRQAAGAGGAEARAA